MVGRVRSSRTVATIGRSPCSNGGVSVGGVGALVALVAVLAAGLVVAPGAALGSPAYAQAGAAAPVRLAGSDRFATAVALSEAGWGESDVVVLATGRGFADALVAGPLAATLDAPILLTEPGRLPPRVGDEIERLGATRVVVLGGPRAVASGVEAEVRGLPGAPEVERIAGVDRYDTAARVARRVAAAATGAGSGGDAQQAVAAVVVASGADFPDALAAANLAARAPRRPIVLVAPGSLPAPSRAVLKELAPSEAIVLGGPGAVSPAVADAVDTEAGMVRRISGPSRYETAAAVAAEALASAPDGTSLVVASGAGFADALAAGALAARTGAVLVLVPAARLTDELDGALRDWSARTAAATLVGGARALSGFVGAEVDAAQRGATRPFFASSGPLPARVGGRLTGVSWRPGCPLDLGDLAYLELSYHDRDGRVRTGELVVAASVAGEVVTVFRSLHDAAFPITSLRLIDDFGGDDDASMAADNTSGFNCRTVAGTSRWSEHAYGRAIDINPIENPFVRGSEVDPPAGAAYVDRDDVRPGMIVRPGPVVDAFAAIGWGWGGDFSSSRDYQHFSSSGR